MWVQVLLMPRSSQIACSPKKWKDLITELVFIVYSRYKTSVAEITSPGKKMSTQWYIGNNEVRKLRITSSPKFNGLFHSSTDEIFHLLQWLATTPILLVHIQKCQAQHVQPQTKGTLYIWQVAFIVITHWCEHRLKITNVALIRIFFYSRRKYKSVSNYFHRYHWTFHSCLLQKHLKVLWVFHLLYIVKIYYTSEGILDHWTVASILMSPMGVKGSPHSWCEYTVRCLMSC